MGTWSLDPDAINDFSIEEWDEASKTQPLGLEPLSDKKDYSKHPVNQGTACYMCGPPHQAVHRLKGGHPVCKRCLDNSNQP